MPATAVARQAAARRADAAAPATSPVRRAPRRAPLAAVPAAVGHTAGAVRVLADSRPVVTITRTRLWIGMLALLLGGIVAINVMSLSVSSSSSRNSELAEQLRRENASLMAGNSGGVTADRVDDLVSSENLILPNPDALSYLTAGSGDAAEAARRLTEGEVYLGLGAGAGTTTPYVFDPAASGDEATAADAGTSATAATADPATQTPAATGTSNPAATGAGGGATTPAAQAPSSAGTTGGGTTGGGGGGGTGGGLSIGG